MEKEEKKKLRLAFGCSLLIMGLLISGRDNHFQQLVHQKNKPEVVRQLEEFQKGGIERAISCENYDVEKVIETAVSYQGTPHRMTGTNQKGIDCSGLIMVAHSSAEIHLPHSAEEQARYGTIVPTMEELKRGDLVFFYDTYPTPKFITHTGIYLGEQKFIHASSSKGVLVSDLADEYYRKHFIFGTRFKTHSNKH
jgi:hypothetical protein